MKMMSMPQQGEKTLVFSIYFALAVSTLLVFWQVRNFDFVNYDDNVYVSSNPHVLNGFSLSNLAWAFTTNLSSHWHPLTWFSLMLDCQLFGPNAGRIRLINLLLHIANTLLLFAVLKKTTGALWPSAFVSALFALHPMHVESVAWIAGRKDVLSTFFLLLTLAAYVGYTNRPSVFRYIAALAVFALGLMAKPMLVTLPFVLLLFDYWPLERKISRHLLIEKIPFFALVAVSSAVTFMVMRSGGTVIDMGTLPLNSRIANAVLSYVRYLYKMFWPQNLAVFYPFDAASISFPQVAMYALLLLGISIFVISFGRKQRYLLLGWFWFVGTLVPVIGIVQVGQQAYADRYTYVPYIGLFIMLAWGLSALLSKWTQRKIALGVSMVIVLTTLGICAHRQASYWNNSVTLFSHAIEVTQNNWLAYYNLGLAYGSLGRHTEAVEDFSQSVKSKPDFEDAYNNLGVSYSSLGRWTEAIDAYKQAIKINPDYAEAYSNLGVAYSGLGRWQQAIDTYNQAIRISPDYEDAHYKLGVAYLVIGDKSSAMAEYNILKSLNSKFANDLFNQINK